MFSYLIRRLWQMIPTILGVLLLVFFLFNWVGGDPAYVLAGKISNPEQIANIRHQLGIDEPVYVQLWIFLKQTICFDFGNSWSTGESGFEHSALKTRAFADAFDSADLS